MSNICILELLKEKLAHILKCFVHASNHNLTTYGTAPGYSIRYASINNGRAYALGSNLKIV